MIYKKVVLGLKAFKKIRNWHDFFMDYAGLKKGNLVLRIGDSKIKIRAGTNDKKIITELVLSEPYFPKWLEMGENSKIIDLGAHIGIFSILAASKFKNAKIFAIEPSEDNFSILEENVNMNKNVDITVSKICLSDKRESVELYKDKNSARHSIVRTGNTEKEIVEAMTLGDFFNEKGIEECDLLKMDIEGAEYPVLFSTTSETMRKIQRIFLEIHDIEGYRKEDLLEFLRGHDFKTKMTEDKSFIYATK